MNPPRTFSWNIYESSRSAARSPRQILLTQLRLVKGRLSCAGRPLHMDKKPRRKTTACLGRTGACSTTASISSSSSLKCVKPSCHQLDLPVAYWQVVALLLGLQASPPLRSTKQQAQHLSEEEGDKGQRSEEHAKPAPRSCARFRHQRWQTPGGCPKLRCQHTCRRSGASNHGIQQWAASAGDNAATGFTSPCSMTHPFLPPAMRRGV